MSKIVYNVGQIRKEMEMIGERVIEKASRKILKDFLNDYVAKVYKKQPNFYQSFRGTSPSFMDGWEWENIKKSAQSISKKMFFNPENLDSFPEQFEEYDPPISGYGVHGSTRWDAMDDVREIMPEIMNRTIASSAPITYERPFEYWTKFVLEYVEGGKLKSLIDSIAKSEGLTIT